MQTAKPHWTVERTHELIREHGVTREAVTARAGLGHATITRWNRAHCSPQIANIEAALNALGYELKIVKMEPDAFDEAQQWYDERLRNLRRAHK